MPKTPPAPPDDPYPHAAYLAVTGDGEVIGVARGHPGSTLVLQFFEGVPDVPEQFTLRPYNVPDGRRAPALVCHTPQGLPALARQKRGGHYVVVCRSGHTGPLCLDAVYEGWLWKRLQAMANRQDAAPPGRPSSPRFPGRTEAPVMPLLPFPLVDFRPNRRR
ncbi:hypothetical protein LAJ19_20325 (plasmid) [Deinococcus taeanensis]|uniref:hypothetical protein n=1 Tax=Deinococcus taeanensis TaxID=2737050 RepID=UPI001CDBC634|nr:hypothetical protein [Deinococcus taeanensis]UBV45474.1 hypothetical protein LAJ19_20325 [Deinococcus taeanensis]